MAVQTRTLEAKPESPPDDFTVSSKPDGSNLIWVWYFLSDKDYFNKKNILITLIDAFGIFIKR